MPIYDKSVRKLFLDMAEELLPEETSTVDRQEVVQWFLTHYPRIAKGTVTAHLCQMSTNAPSRVHYNAGTGHDLLFQIDRRRFRRYDPENDPQPLYAGSDLPTPDIDDDDSGDEDEEAKEFAYERDLRNFLSKNLHVVEPNLRLYRDEDGITGVEFPVGGRSIDILAVDEKGAFVVIELKVSRGYDRAVGQLLRYIGWIDKNLADGKDVRGIIIASSITEDLTLACSRIQGVKLFEYKLAVTLQEVKT